MDNAARAARRAYARRAYEWGRIRFAVARATAVLPVGVAAFFVGVPARASIALSLALFALTTVGGWHRTDAGRGALAGAWVIAIPAALMLFMRTIGSAMPPAQCAQVCAGGAVILGGVAGYILGRIAGTRDSDAGFWFGGAALTTSLFSMAVGCAPLGLGSLLGLTGGFLFVGLPIFVHARVAESN